MPQPVAAPRIIDETGGDEPKRHVIRAIHFVHAFEAGAAGGKMSLTVGHQTPIAGQQLKGLSLKPSEGGLGVLVAWTDAVGKRVMLVPWANVRQLELTE